MCSTSRPKNCSDCDGLRLSLILPETPSEKVGESHFELRETRDGDAA